MTTLERAHAVDLFLLRTIAGLPHPDWLMTVMQAASVAGIGGAIWLLLGAGLALSRQIARRDVGRLVLAIALVHVVVDLGLKPWFDRARPAPEISARHVGLAVPETRSFPSGHAANATAAAVVLAGAVRRARTVVWAAAALVAIARVYLGIHYPLDALAGALLGLACGSLIRWLPLPWRAVPHPERG